jgi:hypothetical protein
MIRANFQTIENKQVVAIALKGGQKKRGSYFGFSVHKLLKTSIEKMSAFCFAKMLMKTNEI